MTTTRPTCLHCGRPISRRQRWRMALQWRDADRWRCPSCGWGGFVVTAGRWATLTTWAWVALLMVGLPLSLGPGWLVSHDSGEWRIGLFMLLLSALVAADFLARLFGPMAVKRTPEEEAAVHPRCRACGYHLRGNPDARVCAECGANVVREREAEA